MKSGQIPVGAQGADFSRKGYCLVSTNDYHQFYTAHTIQERFKSHTEKIKYCCRCFKILMTTFDQKGLLHRNLPNLHLPMYATVRVELFCRQLDTFRRQSLSYVLPSVPHTGERMSGHMSLHSHIGLLNSPTTQIWPAGQL